MNSQQAFAKALEQNSAYIRLLRPEQLNNPTPCSEWDLCALLNHIVYELLWVPELIKGKTVAEVGDRFDGNVLGTDPKAAWQHAADAALVAAHSCRPGEPVHLSRGDVPVEDYLFEVAADVFIHSWDVGQAMNCSVILNESVAKQVYENLLPHKQELSLGGAYAPAVKVAKNASWQEKMLGLSGRSPNWQAK